MTMPTKATAAAIKVADRTRSPSTSRPSSAAMKGAVANRNMALATVVVWMA